MFRISSQTTLILRKIMIIQIVWSQNAMNRTTDLKFILLSNNN